MPRYLKVIQDDLFFAARVETHARRLGLRVEPVNPQAIDHLVPDADAVLVLQLTLHPEGQLDLLQRLRSKFPTQPVVAVTGHLETELRKRAKALGAVLASHSAMDRVLARVCGPGDSHPAGAAPER